MTSFPHLAGTRGERQLAEYIADTWRQQGLTGVRLVPYRVLLSYPDSANPSRVVIYDVRDDTTVFTSQLSEEILHPDDNDTDVVPPYNVFTPAGVVTVLLRVHLLTRVLSLSTRVYSLDLVDTSTSSTFKLKFHWDQFPRLADSLATSPASS